MKHIKTYEEKLSHEEKEKYFKDKFDLYPKKIRKDITYLSEKQGSGYVKYIIETIDYYHMTEEQIHNLRLAVEYDYLDYKDYRDVISIIINSLPYLNNEDYENAIKNNSLSIDSTKQRKFKLAFQKNFKTKIIDISEPYPIAAYKKWFDVNKHDTFNTHDLDEIIGEIPKEYPFGKKYIVGKGRYRGDDNKTLWEKFKNTKRESEFIKVYDESDIHILTPSEIEIIKTKEDVKKFNL